ncbi:MAG: hypothetical protein H8E53_08745, partial [Planctomycetes bacterium]|nr:hypothetical protein [Planctomycetota bacterium]
SFGGNQSRTTVAGGGDITLGAASYSCKDLNGVFTIFSADSTDSTLNLPQLASIDASRHSGTVLVYTVKASAGGAINLSALTSISGPTYDGAKDRIDFIMESGGVINLDSLSTTTSGAGKVRFDIRSAPGGVFSLPALDQSDDAEFIVPTGLTMNLGTAGTPATQVGGGFTLADGAVVNYTPLTKLQWASIDLTGSSELHAPSVVDIDGTAMTLAPGPTLDMGVITSMDDARLAVTGGAKWGVAQGDLAATSYSCANLNGQYTIFSASGSDAALGSSTLDLSTLTSIDASRYSGTVLVYTVRASAGGTIDLSGVTSVSGPTYDGAKDRIDFIMESGGVINLDNLSTTTSGNGKVRFDIRIAPGGVFSLPALEQSDDAEFIVPTGLTMNLGTAGTPATQVGGGFTLADGAVVNYTPLTKLQWASIDLTGSSELHAPSVVDIDGTAMTLAPGPTLDMGVITSMDDARLAVTGGAKWGVAQGDLAATSYSCANLNGQYTIFSASGSDAALGSSTLDLSTLTSIDASRYSGTHLVYTVKASDNGLIDLSSVMSVSAPTYATNDSIDFIAETGGTIDLSSLQTVTVAGNGEARFFVSAGGTMFFGEPLQTDALNLSVAGGASKVIVGGGFHLDPTSDLSITGGATLQIAGDFSHKYASEANLNADDGILHFHTAGDHRLEVAGLDLGAGGSTSGNLGLGRLLVGDVGAEARVTLANLYDNLNPTPGGIEALYLYGSGGLDGLEILGGSMLIIGNVPVYAWIDGEMKDLHTLFGPGEVIIPFQDAGGFNDGWLVIPEPATFTLLTLSGLAILRRKRRV